MPDERADYEALSAAVAADEARSPVSSDEPIPSPYETMPVDPRYVQMDALKTWITDELTPKLTAVLQRIGTLEQQVDLLRQETHGAGTDEYVATFNRAQAEHEATHTSISERLSSTAEEVTDLGARVAAIEGVHIAGLSTEAKAPGQETAG